jgi:hypothetical protein
VDGTGGEAIVYKPRRDVGFGDGLQQSGRGEVLNEQTIFLRAFTDIGSMAQGRGIA